MMARAQLQRHPVCLVMAHICILWQGNMNVDYKHIFTSAVHSSQTSVQTLKRFPYRNDVLQGPDWRGCSCARAKPANHIPHKRLHRAGSATYMLSRESEDRNKPRCTCGKDGNISMKHDTLIRGTAGSVPGMQKQKEKQPWTGHTTALHSAHPPPTVVQSSGRIRPGKHDGKC